MARREIDTIWDRETRNDINENFIELYEGYIDAGLDAEEAIQKAEEALEEVNSVKNQFDQIEGDLSEILNRHPVEDPYREEGQMFKLYDEKDLKAKFGTSFLAASPGEKLVEVDNPNRFVSGDIRVEPMSRLIITPKPGVRYRFYTLDMDKNVVTSYGWRTETYDTGFTSLGHGYVRVLVSYIEERELESHNVSDYLEVIFRRSEKVIYTNSVKSGSVDIEKIKFRKGSVHGTNGQVLPSTSRLISDYIYIKNSTITLNPPQGAQYLIAFYDTKTSEFLEHSGWKADPSNITIEEPRQIKIVLTYDDDRELTESDIDELVGTLKSIKPYNQNKTSADIGNGYYFRGEVIPEIPAGDSALGYNQFISRTWENLRSKYPEYITRSVVIKDTSETFDIYEYCFEPENYKRTVFLVAGIHGDEYEGFWGLYYFMKNICDNYYKHERLRDLRHNTRFVVIPVLNPYGVENRTRGTSRVSDANHNYDVFFDADEYETKGTHGFSENESLAVKITSEKYNDDFVFFADLHTDPYNPEAGNYITANHLSSVFNIAKNLILDEVAYLKDKYNFDAVLKSNIVNTNRRASSFKYMEAVKGVPSVIIEVGTGGLFSIGSSASMTMAVDWYTNVITEALKNDLTQPRQIQKGLEKAILDNRQVGYINSVLNKIPDNGLQVYINHNDFEEGEWKNIAERGNLTLEGFDNQSKTPNGILFSDSRIIFPNKTFNDFSFVIKATIEEPGTIMGTDGGLNLSAVTSNDDSSVYDIYTDDGRLFCSALKYNTEVALGVQGRWNRLYLFVNGERFTWLDASHDTFSNISFGSKIDGSNPVSMLLKQLVLYDRGLEYDELGFVFKSLISDSEQTTD